MGSCVVKRICVKTLLVVCFLYACSDRFGSAVGAWVKQCSVYRYGVALFRGLAC